jgi:hypothetical protein
MKSIRIYGLPRILGLAALVICCSAALASAEMIHGTFTLPFEARWGQAVLSPGNYSFSVDSSGSARLVTSFQGTSNRDEGAVLPQGYTDQQTLDRSELLLVRSGGNYTIRALRLAPEGITINYSVPKGERQMIVQAPQLLQRIPVMESGK